MSRPCLALFIAHSMECIDDSPSGSSAIDELQNSFLSSLAWSMNSCDSASTHLLTRRCIFPSWTWAAWEALDTFPSKSITENLHSPSISFRTYQGQSVRLENFEGELGSSNSTVLFEPCVYLAGWVTNVHLVQVDSGMNSKLSFQILWPILLLALVLSSVPLHAVCVQSPIDKKAI